MASKLNERQQKELRDCFGLFDQDGSGTISVQEMGNCLKALGIEASEDEVQSLVQMMDTDKSGVIEFEEFANALSSQYFNEPTRQELEEAFRYFDSDDSGFITEEELYEAMKKVRRGTSHESVREMIRAVDLNRDGKISIEEFIKIMSSDE